VPILLTGAMYEESLYPLLYSLMCKHLLTLKVVKFQQFKSHNMFWTMWPSSGVKKHVYLMRKLLLLVVAAIACVGPSDVHVCVVGSALCSVLL
jgi:hypothetical protein